MSDLHFWQSRYESGDTQWDKGAPSPGLEEFLENHPLNGLILVPGCGTGHDVRLAAVKNASAQVMGFDFAPGAIALAGAAANPPNATYRRGDFLRLAADMEGIFDWMIEHTLFCAIHPAHRSAYVESAARALRPGGYLVAVFYMTPEFDDGVSPPHGCSAEELDGLFQGEFDLLREWMPGVTYETRAGRERMRLMRRKM